MTFPRQSPVVATASSAPDIIDPATGMTRRARSDDIARIAHLVNELPGFDVFSISTLADDAPAGQFSLSRFYPALKNCLKPVRTSVMDRREAEQMIQLGELIAGSKEAYRARPFINFGYCAIVSPLTMDFDSTEMLMYFAENDITAYGTIAPMGGLSTPFSLAGMLTLMNAEWLAAAVLAQMSKPGTAQIYNFLPVFADMRSGAYASGAIEIGMMNAAVCQMARFYNVPSGGYLGLTNAKLSDAQSGFEKGMSPLMGALAGVDFIVMGGLLDALMSFDFGQLVIDDEIAQMVKHVRKGFGFSHEALGFDEIRQAGPAGMFAGNAQTLARMTTATYMPQLADRKAREQWAQEGASTIHQRAMDKALDILSTPNAAALDSAVDARIHAAFEGLVRGDSFVPRGMGAQTGRADGAARAPRQSPPHHGIDQLTRTNPMDSKLPSRARVVVIGGGVIGCSVAYHLAKRGWTDVVVLERLQLTHGSTWHAAGLVGQLRSSSNLTRLMRYGAQLYGSLEQETGQATGWRMVGSLRLAASQDRWTELKRAATMGRGFGLDVELISPKQARDLFPLIETAGLLGAAWIASDGYVDPTSLTNAYAAGARAHGVKIIQNVLVTRLLKSGRRVTGVVTDCGTIEADCVVNAAGMWGGEVAAMTGTRVPVCALEHQYLVTEKSDRIPSDLPTLRDPDARFYVKPEPGALCVGGWENRTLPFGQRGIAKNFGPELLQPDFDRFAEYGVDAAKRIPYLDEVGVRTMVNGPIPITADGEPIIGLSPELDNFYLCCGFTSGIAASGGAGSVMANWIIDGDPGMDLWPFDVRRFGQPHVVKQYHVRARDRKLRALLRYRLPPPRNRIRTQRTAQSAAPCAAGQGCGVRQQVRMGAPELVRACRRAGQGHARDSSVDRSSRSSATSIARCARRWR